jgi:hypothetical protein
LYRLVAFAMNSRLAAAISMAQAHGVEVVFEEPAPPVDIDKLTKAFTVSSSSFYYKSEIPRIPKPQRTYPKIPPRKL